MRDSFREKYHFAKSSQPRRLPSTMKPSASSIFSKAVRSRIIRKLPDGQISMESPKQLALLSRSKSLCEQHRKVDSRRSTALSKLLSDDNSHTLSSRDEKMKQICSYTDGAYSSIAKTKLLQLTENLRPRLQCETYTLDHELLLSTPVILSQTSNQNSIMKTSVLDHMWHSPVKISNNCNQNAMIRTPKQVETPAIDKKMSWTSKDAREAERPTLRKLYHMNQDEKPGDISKFMQDVATAPFLNIPTDIDFNDKMWYSPAEPRTHQSRLRTGSSILRLSTDSSNLESELSHRQLLKDCDAFRWQPRSPEECWQPSVLL